MPFTLHTVRSRHLAGNAWGDSADRDLVVYVPQRSAQGMRPRLVVLLHGYSGHAVNWLSPDQFRGSSIRPALAALLDDVFADPAVQPAIVAMPDGWTRLGGGQWLNSPVNGDFVGYVAEEVVGVVEEAYGTDPDPGSRVVLGHSSGGLGAWELATTTDRFGALGVLAGDAFFERTQLGMVTELLTRYREEEIDPSDIPNDAALPLALAASYAPDPTARLRGRLPLDWRTGALVDEVWAQWLAYDPVVNAAARRDRLAGLHGILLDVGARDEFAAQLGHRTLSARLDGLGIRHDAVEFDGTHSSHTHERVARAIGDLLRSRAPWAKGIVA
ncbi:alpha/beta hydrolase-fold protein [Microbacterium sp.]|uniref:alpha/beta hydrolase-fold protein n=1 Tax=Microbacterium sp. TaxID=51671 RepID=UPI0039E71946